MLERSEIFFIKVFFRILASFFVLITVSVFVFKINDSVSFQTGEILAENPQLDYKAPFEAIPDSVYVREGQSVKAGDTLMVLRSEQVQKDFNSTQTLLGALKKTNNTLEG